MTRRFKFPLEPVLTHRERIEDEKQQALAARTMELRRAQSELARLDSEFRRYSGVLRDGHADLSSDELRAHYAHLEYLDRRIVMQHASISALASAVERARTELVDARKDKKVIEKLKEQRLEQHRALLAADEQKELDESNARRYRSTA